jgi:hypothetical protein
VNQFVSGKKADMMAPTTRSSRVLSIWIFFRCSCGQVKIISPRELRQEFAETDGIIYGATATFGAPSYGDLVLGRVLYAESHGNAHCSDADYKLPDPEKSSLTTINTEGQKLVNVVLVRRGQCTFATKVRVAQAKKAHAVIMIDKKTSQKTPEEIQRVVMADDGSGPRVKIPSVLISNSEGEKLVESVAKGPVIVELRWNIPRAQVVLIDFWMSSGSEEAADFLEKFKDPAERLKYHVQFVPHYHVFSLPPGSSFGHLCKDPTTAKHCGPDPDGPGPITGEMVVNEDLRQLCLWHISREANPLQDPAEKGATYSLAFWEYVVRRREECPLSGKDPKYTFGHTCSYRLMRSLDVDMDQVRTCTHEKADLYLDAEVENVAWSPQALRLNGWRYNGPLDQLSVLKAICSGFLKQPEACQQFLQPSIGVKTIIRKVVGVAYSTFFQSLVVLAIIIGAAFYLYRWYMTTSVRQLLRDEVMLEVQSQIADYAVLEDGHDGSGKGGRPLSF